MAQAYPYPAPIYTGAWTGGHIQGIAVDRERGWIYYSFTTLLVKSDLSGRILGSVRGLVGHLGCLAFRREDGKVYGSLEYKDDAIGRGILRSLGQEAPGREGFYIAIFDGERIDRLDMDAESDGVMTAVHLRDVVEDYQAVWQEGERTLRHRYGCSGIDGVSFGPDFGAGAGSRRYLHVAYGIYGDTDRADNDCQVLLQYDVEDWSRIAQPLCQSRMHESGPAACRNRFFVPTGNTDWGVQNLEYDPATGNYLLCVYPGRKERFPNFPLYIVDGSRAPVEKPLPGMSGSGLTLSLWEAGVRDAATGIYGWRFPYGSTGIAALGDGLFYVSHDGRAGDRYDARIHLYRWTGDAPDPFILLA